MVRQEGYTSTEFPGPKLRAVTVALAGGGDVLRSTCRWLGPSSQPRQLGFVDIPPSAS